jgi:1-deoxy-D-xylulose-5-phosphate reductoisomerase
VAIKNLANNSIMKKIAIFGSTGSIGKSTLAVIKNDLSKFKIVTLVAKNDYKTLISQALEFNPQYVVIENDQHIEHVKTALEGTKIQVMSGSLAIIEVAKIKYDLVVSSIVGFAGLLPTITAIRAGSNIALANKETLVCGGNFLIEEAKKHQVKILPIDSEHNAIFQIFEHNNINLIDEIILTASGGPFFNSTKNFNQITKVEALKHPKWQMGAKISIDSATMMNKGLEMIEAFYLFPIKKSQIKIIIHPQSIIHGMVNYSDGSTLAMMSLPDMQTPISFAINYPNRLKILHQKLNLCDIQKLEFFAVDDNKFLAIKLSKQALEVEGNAPTILNASNEIAVEKFLNDEITFDKIPLIVNETLNKISFKNLDSIEDILITDLQAREIAKNLKI